MTNDFNQAKRMTLGSHNHQMLRGLLSLVVSLALDSWLFGVSHLTKSVKEREGRDTKRVRGALLVYTGPHTKSTPWSPSESQLHRVTHLCALICADSKLSCLDEEITWSLKSQVQAGNSLFHREFKHGSVLKVWSFVKIGLVCRSLPWFNSAFSGQWISTQMQLTGWVKWKWEKSTSKTNNGC